MGASIGGELVVVGLSAQVHSGVQLQVVLARVGSPRFVVVGQEARCGFPGVVARSETAPSRLELETAVACAMCDGLLQFTSVWVLVVGSGLHLGVEQGPGLAGVVRSTS